MLVVGVGVSVVSSAVQGTLLLLTFVVLLLLFIGDGGLGFGGEMGAACEAACAACARAVKKRKETEIH